MNVVFESLIPPENGFLCLTYKQTVKYVNPYHKLFMLHCF